MKGVLTCHASFLVEGVSFRALTEKENRHRQSVKGIFPLISKIPGSTKILSEYCNS